MGPTFLLNNSFQHLLSCGFSRRNSLLLRDVRSSSCWGSSDWSSWEWPKSRNHEEGNVSGATGQHNKQLLIPSDMETEKAISILMRFTSEQRAKFLRKVLRLRTSRVRCLFENPSNYNNVFASLRTLDSFAIHYTDIINNTSKRGEGNSRKQSMLSSLGAVKWLSVNHHNVSTKDVLTKLKYEQPELCVVVSDIHCENSQSLYDIQWTSKCPSVVVFGNEERGVSEEVRSMADVSFYIPMKGFAESLNLSASVAVTCAHLEHRGVLTPNLSEREMDSILLKWLLNSVRGSEAILRRYSSSNSSNQQ